MKQEVQVTLTLEVDVTQSKEDITKFVQEMIEKYPTKNGYGFMPLFTVKEEAKIYNTEPNLFDTNFVITGTKEELLEVEKVLRANGIKDDNSWNEKRRVNESCIIIAAYGLFDSVEKTYNYLREDSCNLTTYTFQQFMKLVKPLQP